MPSLCRKLVSCVAAAAVWALLPAAHGVEVIVDNDNGLNSGGSTFTILSGGTGGGTGWKTSSSTGGYYGTNYAFKDTTGSGSTSGEVEWRPSLPSSGAYEVAVRYTQGSNRSPAAPYTVDYDGGSQSFPVNQTSGGGQWVALGTFNFAAGTSGRVRLSNQTTGNVVVADAVRFSSVSGGPELTMAVSPSGGGTTIPVVGTSTRTLNEVVNLTATANAGYAFSQWTVSAGSGVANPSAALTTVTMDQSKTVTAVFTSTGMAPPEFRCMWVTRFEWPNSNEATCKAKIDEIMTKLQAANFNAVMFQMRGQCDTLYPSPDEPWSPLIVPGMADPGTDIGWDPMAYAIKAAHDHGLEFHAYINTQTCWAMGSSCAYTEPPNPYHVFHQHCKASDPDKRDWLLHNNSGLDVNDNLPNKTVGSPVQCAESNYVWLSPTVPDVHAWVRKQIMYVVTHYDGSDPVNRPAIQAVHWDRIRTPSSSSTTLQYSHDPISVARFNGGEANPDNLDYYAWTREAINRFTRDIYAQINEVRPEVVVSSSPLGLYSPERYVQYGYPQSNCGYQYEYTCVHQDGQDWLAGGSMDILNPQIYWADEPWRTVNPHYSQILPDWIANRAGRFMCPGHIGAVGSHPVESIIAEIQATRAMGGQGDVVFSYGMWDNPDFNGWAGFTDPVTGIYQQPAPIPPMTWKTSPTDAIILGNVTGIDGVTPVMDAQITRNGSPYVALSSGDGLYSMLKVAPGTYTLTCNKNGLGQKVIQNVTVAAGDVRRVNISYAPPPTRTILAWRSVRMHGPAGSLAIELDPSATGDGSNGPTVETRSGGIQSIEVQFDGPITLDLPSGVSVIGRTTVNGSLEGPVSYASTVGVAGDTLTLEFAPGLLPDAACYTISIGPGTLAETVAGDADCLVRCLEHDTTGGGYGTLTDVIWTATKAGPAAVNPAHDVDLSGTVDATDAQAIKAALMSPPRAALCP